MISATFSSASGSQENSVEKISCRQENTMALKDELVPKPRQKSVKRHVWNPRKTAKKTLTSRLKS